MNIRSLVGNTALCTALVLSFAGCSSWLHPFKSYYTLLPSSDVLATYANTNNWKHVARQVVISLEWFSMDDRYDNKIFEIVTGRKSNEVSTKDGYRWEEYPSSLTNAVFRRTCDSMLDMLRGYNAQENRPNTLTLAPDGVRTDYIIRGSITELIIYAEGGTPDSVALTISAAVLMGDISQTPYTPVFDTTITYREPFGQRCLDRVPAMVGGMCTNAMCCIIARLCGSVKAIPPEPQRTSIPVRDDHGHPRALILFGDSGSARGRLAMLVPGGDTLHAWGIRALKATGNSAFECISDAPIPDIRMTLRFQPVAPGPHPADTTERQQAAIRRRRMPHAPATQVTRAGTPTPAQWELIVDGAVASPLRYTMTPADAARLRHALLQVVPAAGE
ncbi:MAG TPA: hypothetical protein VHI13_02755 [Candidatus Kapabacteria bacterium]|nr:hypothetical protein [Candidatus Kapabacteria bacterium]